MSMEIKPATRKGVKPLICLYSESGCGKTMSALLLARGMAGDGKMVMVDSESGRGELYADVAPMAPYNCLQLEQPFTPARYIEAIDAVEASGAVIGIIDSGSHEWEGIGGVLDQAGEIEQRSGKPGLHCWRMPKLEHAKFVQRLLRSKIPWVVCLRAKYKSRQTKDERGKAVIIKDDHTSPLQAEDFIFEATAHAEIMSDHSIHLTKCSHPTLRECFPAKGPITIEHGRKLAEWCNMAASIPTGSKTDDLKADKKKLWKAIGRALGKEPDMLSALDFLRCHNILGANETLDGLTREQLNFATDKTEIVISENSGITP